MSSQAQPLSIAIVGAGIAGLTAALSLQKQGHHVTVFEQSRLASEIGAAFHITPNASAVLSNLGIDPVEGGAVHFRETVFMDDKTGKIINKMPKSGKFMDLPKGEDWLLAHRYHLHKQLKDAAVERGVNLLTAKRVVSVDVEKHQVNCEDGTSHTAHVIIGSDGVHSKVREALYPDATPFSTPWAAFRFILKWEDIQKRASAFREDMFQHGTMYMWGKPETQFLVYPMSNEAQWNFVCLFATKALDIDTEHDSQYSKKASKDQLMHVYKDFEPQVQELMQMVDSQELRYWPLMDMKDLPSYVSGDICLIGDSSHPFLPFAYQGAGLAIEDGAAIGSCLEGVTKPEEVAARLKLYEELRHERSSMEQQFSRDLFRDHSKEMAWDPSQAFENIYLYRILNEAMKLKQQYGFA